MAATKLKAFLDSRGVRYISIRHSMAFTAAEVAASAHVKGRDFAKTVIVRMDGTMVMILLPASRRIELHDLRELLGTDHIRLATEAEFTGAFPDCEVGAMPPFGNLYEMPVYVAACLAEEQEIAFNAGTHSEVITLAYEDFEQLVQPIVIDFVTT